MFNDDKFLFLLALTKFNLLTTTKKLITFVNQKVSWEKLHLTAPTSRYYKN